MAGIEIAGLALRRVVFPGRAGELQRAKATSALVSELGDRYAEYHADLAARIDALRIPALPPRGDGQGATIEAGVAAIATLQELVMAEMVLRQCRAFRVEGRRLSEASDQSVPLMNDQGRLLSLETGKPAAGASKDSAIPWGTPPTWEATFGSSSPRNS
jgi:hypothetical protein